MSLNSQNMENKEYNRKNYNEKIAEIAKIFWSVAKQMTHEAGNVKPGGGMAWCSKKYEKANTSREWPRLC